MYLTYQSSVYTMYIFASEFADIVQTRYRAYFSRNSIMNKLQSYRRPLKKRYFRKDGHYFPYQLTNIFKFKHNYCTIPWKYNLIKMTPVYSKCYKLNSRRMCLQFSFLESEERLRSTCVLCCSGLL